jgi:hypothetical protein
MSFEQILQAEVARRMGDTRWAEKLTEQSDRGLTVERLWIKSLRLNVRHEIALSERRQEAMLAALLAARARRMGDGLRATAPVNATTSVR